MREGRTTNAIPLISHAARFEGSRKDVSQQILRLRIVHRAAKALLTGRILHVFQTSLLFFQLSLHPFYALLLFPLALVPAHAIFHTVGWSEADRLVEFIHLALQGGDLVFLRENLGLHVLGRLLWSV